MSLARFLIVALFAGVALFAWGHHQARRDPVVRHATIRVPGLPQATPPTRIVLLSDIHMGNLTMDSARLTRIVWQVNALSPDLVVIAGDLVAGHAPQEAARSAPALTAPLERLTPRLGTAAVLGNHDQATRPDLVAAALRRAGITVLENDAIQRGPLKIGGIGDVFTHHQDVGATLAMTRAINGFPVAISHGPSIRHYLKGDVTVLLAGHTHCGQIVLPPLVKKSRYCGLVREPGRITIVTAGLGTSILPLRFGTPPDLWVVTIAPLANRSRS